MLFFNKPKPKGLNGWKPDHPDRRDFYYKAKKVYLPKKVELTKFFSKVESQGQLGSCTGQALVGALEYLENKEKRKFEDLSRLFVYYNERLIEGTINEDSGAMIRNGIKSLKTYGVCSESFWPYIEKKFTKKPNKKCYDDALNHNIIKYARLESLNDMKTCLAEGFPFVCGISIYDSFDADEVTNTGVVPMPKDEEKCNGGHAVVCCGYDDETQRFLMRNSWGSNWGIEGYFTIPYEYLSNPDLACDFWVIYTME